jgi:hypothetical protein
MKIKMWGGFHNIAPVNIVAQVIDDGKGETAWISPGQQARLDRQFCGVKGCGCGGASRARYSLPEGWRIGWLGHRGEIDAMIAYGPDQWEWAE